MGMNTVELEFYRRSARRSTSPRSRTRAALPARAPERLVLGFFVVVVVVRGCGLSCPVKPVLLRVSLSLSPAAARRATRKYSLRAIMMALSPEFNWLDNSDKISPQPAGNLGSS